VPGWLNRVRSCRILLRFGRNEEEEEEEAQEREREREKVDEGDAEGMLGVEKAVVSDSWLWEKSTRSNTGTLSGSMFGRKLNESVIMMILLYCILISKNQSIYVTLLVWSFKSSTKKTDGSTLPKSVLHQEFESGSKRDEARGRIKREAIVMWIDTGTSNYGYRYRYRYDRSLGDDDDDDDSFFVDAVMPLDFEKQ